MCTFHRAWDLVAVSERSEPSRRPSVKATAAVFAISREVNTQLSDLKRHRIGNRRAPLIHLILDPKSFACRAEISISGFSDKRHDHRLLRHHHDLDRNVSKIEKTRCFIQG